MSRAPVRRLPIAPVVSPVVVEHTQSGGSWTNSLKNAVDPREPAAPTRFRSQRLMMTNMYEFHLDAFSRFVSDIAVAVLRISVVDARTLFGCLSQTSSSETTVSSVVAIAVARQRLARMWIEVSRQALPSRWLTVVPWATISRCCGVDALFTSAVPGVASTNFASPAGPANPEVRWLMDRGRLS